MYVIEFEADISNGAIKLPAYYHEMDSKHVKVIAWVQDSEANKQAVVPEKEKTAYFADGYISQHWRQLIITSAPNPLEDDDAVLQEEYGAYLGAKHYS